MSISQGTTSVTVSTQERTWRINIETPFNADPVLTVFREQVKLDASNNIIGKAATANPVVRHFSAIASTSFTVGTTTMSGQQIAEFIKGVADQLRQADMSAGIA